MGSRDQCKVLNVECKVLQTLDEKSPEIPPREQKWSFFYPYYTNNRGNQYLPSKVQAIFLEQRLAIFFCKGPQSKYFKWADHNILMVEKQP